DAASSAIRLLDMGAEGYLVASILRAVIAQRLVRRICKSCIQEYKPSDAEYMWLSSIPHFNFKKKTFYQGKGCPYCHNTGYRGQTGVFELLEISPPLAEMIRVKDTASFYRCVLTDPQFRPLVLNGLDLVEHGVTTLSELIRIMGEGMLDTSVQRGMIDAYV
ncbi:MAG TPA: MSHA biogenesis protein MshE, partial [Gammaproteobacteria bacterium]|nr:MSHA biogenesis protein MshE [Gammaproteobacteria bacterium]